ncbi:MAG: sugar ABC transporter permease [bacterium]|nr:sugar ABC transporter permease [bacterium]
MIETNIDKLTRKKHFNPEKRKTMLFFAYISPWLIGLLCFTVIPIVISFILSFTNVSMMNFSTDPWEFVGIDNYIDILTEDTYFQRAILNTFVYAFVKVFLLTFIALLIALLLNKKIVGRKVYRILIYLPSVIPVVSVAMLWKMIFTGNEQNIISFALSFLGIQPINFFGSEFSSMSTIIFIGIWNGLGPTMLILLAGIQGIDSEIVEASELDGVNVFQKFFHIVLPSLYPTLFFVILTGLISSLQAYAEVKLLTNGGPGISTLTTSLLIVQNAFNSIGKKTLGYASAQGWIIFVLTLVLTLIYMTANNAKEKKDKRR